MILGMNQCDVGSIAFKTIYAFYSEGVITSIRLVTINSLVVSLISKSNLAETVNLTFSNHCPYELPQAKPTVAYVFGEDSDLGGCRDFFLCVLRGRNSAPFPMEFR